MLRVGVDIMDVERIARGVERYGDKFYNRVFTEKERCLCEGNPQRLAARFERGRERVLDRPQCRPHVGRGWPRW